MTPPLDLADAQARLLALAAPLAVEGAPAEEALGRYLAEPLIAARTQPAADLSAMDGYALNGDGPWRVVGESRGGRPFASPLGPGEAVAISTGAAMPVGADAVLIKEQAERDGNRLTTTEAPQPDRYIRRAGFDFRAGDVLLPVGAAVTPAALALALSAGRPTLRVRRRPRVAILDSGDELAADPADCPPHLVPASNGAMLAAMASRLPCHIERIGPVPDGREALAAALARAGDCDLLVTSGGASVGEHDLIRPALEDWGAELAFWRVAIRPGKPLIVARRGARIVLGLPGNPASSFVTGFLFMLPLLRALLGAARPLPAPLMLPCARDIDKGGARREFLRARIEGGAVAPLGEQDSSALLTLAQAAALIDRPARAPRVKAGTPVPIYPLENRGIA